MKEPITTSDSPGSKTVDVTVRLYGKTDHHIPGQINKHSEENDKLSVTAAETDDAGALLLDQGAHVDWYMSGKQTP